MEAVSRAHSEKKGCSQSNDCSKHNPDAQIEPPTRDPQEKQKQAPTHNSPSEAPTKKTPSDGGSLKPGLVPNGSDPPAGGSLASGFTGRGLHAAGGSDQGQGIPEPPASGLHASFGRGSHAAGVEGGGVPRSTSPAGVLHASGSDRSGRGLHAAGGADQGPQTVRDSLTEGLHASLGRGMPSDPDGFRTKPQADSGSRNPQTQTDGEPTSSDL